MFSQHAFLFSSNLAKCLSKYGSLHSGRLALCKKLTQSVQKNVPCQNSGQINEALLFLFCY